MGCVRCSGHSKPTRWMPQVDTRDGKRRHPPLLLISKANMPLAPTSSFLQMTPASCPKSICCRWTLKTLQCSQVLTLFSLPASSLRTALSGAALSSRTLAELSWALHQSAPFLADLLVQEVTCQSVEILEPVTGLAADSFSRTKRMAYSRMILACRSTPTATSF